MFHAVSFLCGVFTGRKKEAPPPPIEDAAPEKGEDRPDSHGVDPTPFPENDLEIPQQPVLLPPPPGGAGRHMRTLSCQHTRSNSGVSKLVSSLSLRVGAGSAPVREEKGRHKEKKYFKHEDSIWKKTIILGEKCRVPDENEEHILYDEKGNRIPTYHPKTHSGVLTFSRQLSGNQDELSKK